MPIFRGNVGNLMQHWVLCELLAACKQHYDEIMFIDAHAMAPLATERPRRDQTAHWFDRVRDRLPGERTPYENAWHTLASGGAAYPNSANFVTALWTGSYSLVLCESDQTTAHELEAWAGAVRGWPRCLGVEFAFGDWRERFRPGFASSAGLTFISFDPYMFNRHGASNPGQMGPADLAVAVMALAAVSGPALIQALYLRCQ